MNTKIIFLLVLGLNLSQARSNRLDMLGRILSIKDTDYEANFYDWMNNPLGLLVDKTYPYRELGFKSSWVDGDFCRLYEPKSVWSNSIRFDQRTVFSAGKRVFLATVSFQHQNQQDVYRCLTLNPYDQPFKILDYSTGDSDGDQMNLRLAYTHYIWRGLALSPLIDYSLENSLKKTFVKADTIIRRSVYGLSLGWFTPGTQWFVSVSDGDGKNRLNGPKDKSSPVVLLQIGDDLVIIKSTAPTYSFVREMKMRQFAAGQILRIGADWYSAILARYDLEKSTFRDGVSTKDYWGFYQEENWLIEYSIRYLPDKKGKSWGLQVEFNRRDGWSRSFSNNYLFQELTFDRFSATVAYSHEIRPVIVVLHHQLAAEILKNHDDDYMGKHYVDNTGIAFILTNSGEYLLNESLHLLGVVELGTVQNNYQTDYHDYNLITLRGGIQKDFRNTIMEISAGGTRRFSSSDNRSILEMAFNFTF